MRPQRVTCWEAGGGVSKCTQRGNLFRDPENRVGSRFFSLSSPVPTLLITISRAPLFLSPFGISHSSLPSIGSSLRDPLANSFLPSLRIWKGLAPTSCLVDVRASLGALCPPWCWVHGYSQLGPPLQKHLPPDFTVFKSTMHIIGVLSTPRRKKDTIGPPNPKSSLGPQFSPTCTVQSCERHPGNRHLLGPCSTADKGNILLSAYPIPPVPFPIHTLKQKEKNLKSFLTSGRGTE